jgi:hypothetical protein
VGDRLGMERFDDSSFQVEELEEVECADRVRTMNLIGFL